jgi:SAM-dependent methyltransferase
MPVRSFTARDRAVLAPHRDRKVLHAGCGTKAAHRLHPMFKITGNWEEIRLDVDPGVKPDIVCSTVDMRHAVASGSVDAVWSSHSIEHLHDHEVPRALSEFRRVLRNDGFALIRCPDIEAVVEAIARHGLESLAYTSPAGPITPLDMLYGHRASIARGEKYMAHHTAFTDTRLARLLLEAGFSAVNTRRAPGFDLWAVAFLPDTPIDKRLAELAQAGLDIIS